MTISWVALLENLCVTQNREVLKRAQVLCTQTVHTYPLVRSILSHAPTSHALLFSHDHKQIRLREHTRIPTHTHTLLLLAWIPFSLCDFVCMRASSQAVERGWAGGPEDSWFNNLKGTPLWSVCIQLCAREIGKQLPQGEVWICDKERTELPRCCDGFFNLPKCPFQPQF